MVYRRMNILHFSLSFAVSIRAFCFHFSFSYLLIESEIIQYMKKLCLVLVTRRANEIIATRAIKEACWRERNKFHGEIALQTAVSRPALNAKMDMVVSDVALQRAKHESQENSVSILTRKWFKNCARGHRLRFLSSFNTISFVFLSNLWLLRSLACWVLIWLLDIFLLSIVLLRVSSTFCCSPYIYFAKTSPFRLALCCCCCCCSSRSSVGNFHLPYALNLKHLCAVCAIM